MKNYLKLFLLFVSILMGYGGLYAQGVTVSGTVTDASSGESLPGVTITLKGSTAIGTVSNADGNYSLTLPNSSGAVLQFSYLGFLTQSVPVQGKTAINVKLLQDTKALSEVVVTAYGTAKKANLTTAQIGVSEKQINETVNTTIEQAMQGRAAGVYITQNSGQPGGSISVNIRGVNSLTGTNEPLYVIDGVQIQGSSTGINNAGQVTAGGNPLAGLNPSDIADMQILQGPSASALYGSKATNGVIIITTKRGKVGDIRINYAYQLTEQQPPKELDMMNLQQYAAFATMYAGTTNVPGEFLDPSLLGKGTDWQNVLFRNVAMYKHTASVSGGSDKLTYFLSGEYLNQEGVAVGSGFNRYGFRLNVDNKAYNWLTIGLNLNYNQTNEKLSTTSDVIGNALRMTPQVPVKNADGSWGGSDAVNGASEWVPPNPIAIANLITSSDVQRQFIGGANVQLNILPGLIFRTTLNANVSYRNSNYFRPTYYLDKNNSNSQDNSEFDDTDNMNTYWNMNELLEYSKTIGLHTFDIMASHEAQSWAWKSLQGIRKIFPTNDVVDLSTGDPTKASANGGQGDGAMESYLGRLNYNYGERYILSGTIRADGSSNFGQNNRWGTFPSLSAAWRIAKEPWYHIDFMDEAKLRFEWGTTGNQGPGGIYATMRSGPTPWGTGFSLNQYPNPDLKWESTSTYNGGINLGFLKNRIQFEGDVYVKYTDNLILSAPLPDYMGAAQRNGIMGAINPPNVNFGSLKNEGLALSLNTTNIDNKSFTWSSNFNISFDRPVVTKLNTNSSQAIRHAPFDVNMMELAQVGKAPWVMYGYVFDGYYKSVDDINKSARPVDNTGTPWPASTDETKGILVGDVKFKDINGDGHIDTQDQTVIGNPWPKFYGGFTNTFSYKGFDLNVLLTFTYGNDIYNYQKMVSSNPHSYWVGQNVLQAVTDYAQVGADGNLLNPNAYGPRLSGGSDVNGDWNHLTNRWIEDGSFIRVKNVSLTYTVPKALVNKQKAIKDVKLTLSAQNLFTFTKYTGYDPEVGAFVGTQSYGVMQQVIGVDYGKYPLTPIYTFSVNVNL